MVSFLKQGLGLKVSAAKLYPNFPLVHPSGTVRDVFLEIMLVSLWTGARCKYISLVGINTFVIA